jgi:predicted DCC family thiol-disulfide oxidoreductase YuxK
MSINDQLAPKPRRLTLIYDGECTLCLRFQHIVQRLDQDRQIAYYSLHEQDLYRLFPQLSLEQCQENVHVIDQEGRVYVGSETMAQLCQVFPSLKSFAWMLESKAGAKASELFYQSLKNLAKLTAPSCEQCPDHAKK